MADAAWFGGRLRELREGQGLTQDQLAGRVGVQRDAVARWERGAREPSWSNVLALCEALGVGCEEFCKAPGERPAPKPGRPIRRAAEVEEPLAPKQSRGRARKGK
jgi:transcriptional regulator with XRE-family HTH domain